MKTVIVEWHDARFQNMWDCSNNDLHIINCCTIGILKRENKDEIEVCSHINDEMKAGVMAIPKSAIIRMRDLIIKRRDNGG